MIKLKYHQTLSEEKWLKFPLFKQMLMIANELNRANNWMEKKDFPEVKLCYERAFELLYMTISTMKEKKKRRELLRFKEALAMAYIKDIPEINSNLALLKVLFTLDKDCFSLSTYH